jgi:pimeloyl-ACP methyl ester carboxylesterase
MWTAHLIDALRLARRKPPPVRPNESVIRVRGGRIRVYDSSPGRGDRPTVVIAPDGPNAVEHYADLVALLADRLRVVVFDLPGFGFSSPAFGYRFRLEDGAAATLAVLDALGVARATLAFPCANGFYAAAAARMAPERVQSLVLAQTPAYEAMRAWVGLRIPWVLRTPVLGQVATAVGTRVMARRWYRVAAGTPEAGTRLERTADAVFAGGGCFCLAGIVQGLTRGSAADLAGVRVPVYVAWGNADPSHAVTPPTSIRDMFPHAHIEVYDGCGHFPDLESPARFAELLVTAADAG